MQVVGKRILYICYCHNRHNLKYSFTLAVYKNTFQNNTFDRYSTTLKKPSCVVTPFEDLPKQFYLLLSASSRTPA